MCKRNSRRRYVKVSGDSPETMRKLCFSTKLGEITVFYAVLVLSSNIFVQLFFKFLRCFFLFFLSKRLSVTFDIQIDLKMKHP